MEVKMICIGDITISDHRCIGLSDRVTEISFFDLCNDEMLQHKLGFVSQLWVNDKDRDKAVRYTASYPSSLYHTQERQKEIYDWLMTNPNLRILDERI